MPSLELSMIVKNGASTLERCLESVRGIVDAISIGDTGSSDASKEIARRCGARVLDVPWENDFARARNAVLEQVRADWVLFLDADEMLDNGARQVIAPLLLDASVYGYEVLIWNYVHTLTNRFWDQPAKPNPNCLPAAEAFPAYVEHRNIRLFRRHPEIFFENRVHEGVGDSLKRGRFETRESSLIIHHLGIAEDDAESRSRKNVLYQALGLEKIRENPSDALAHFELGIGELEQFHNPAAALPYFERVVALTPTAHLAWTFAGICLVRLGRIQEGLRRLERAEQLGAQGPVLLEAKGDAFYQLENLQAARVCYESAQLHEGQSALLDSKLGVCEVRLGEAAQGLRRVRQAVEREPGFAELHDILTATALLLGDIGLAADAAERRLSIGAPTEEHFLRAASLGSQLKDEARVRKIVRTGQERFPESQALRSFLFTERDADAASQAAGGPECTGVSKSADRAIDKN